MLKTIVRERRGRLLALGMAAIALLLLAAGISSLDLAAGEARAVAPLDETVTENAPATVEPIAVDIEAASPIFLLMVVLLTVALVVGMFRSRAIRISVFIMALLALGLIVFAELFLATAEPTGLETGAAALGNLLPQAVEEAAVPGFVREPTDWMTTAIGALLVALVLGVAGYIWYARRPQPAAEQQALFSLARDARITLGELQTGADVRDAVLAAYVTMSQTLQRIDGLTRGPAITPHEFEKQLVRAGLPARAVARLTRLFEQVRYGGLEAGERERREAIGCMETIIAAARARHDIRTRTAFETQQR